tara:strand:+ start:186 stop:587 length:402 start_codon:yes stop_codon:yes gene_type:complete
MLNDLKNISKFFLIPAFVYFFAWVAFFLELYAIFPWFDILMHIIGGMSVAFAYFFTLKYFERRRYLKLNTFFMLLFVVSLVALTAVLWEFYEFILTFVTGMSFQGNLQDTISDFFFGILGGLTLVIILEKAYN